MSFRSRRAAGARTRASRSRSGRKEEANDYRYFPEPDLPPLVISREWVEEIRAKMPELPDAKRERFLETYGLSPYDAEQLTAERALADFFEAAVGARPASDASARAKSVANWTLGDLRRLLNASGHRHRREPVSRRAAMAELVELVEAGKINGKQAKDVLEKAFESGELPWAIVAREGIAQISPTRASLRAVVAEVIAENPKAVEDYKSGKTSAVQFLVGQVMKRTKGRAKPDSRESVVAGEAGAVLSIRRAQRVA